jgi:predicted CXXCH cytochrome family protein
MALSGSHSDASRARSQFSRMSWCAAAVVSASMLLVGCGGGNDDPTPPDPDRHASNTNDAPVVTPVAVKKPTQPLEPGASCITEACHAYMGSASSIHPQIELDDCTVCHEPDQGGHVYPLREPGSALCMQCHSVTGNAVYQHMGSMGADCTACHEPHASNTAFQLRAMSVRDLCNTCHVQAGAAVEHEPFAAGACMSCHEPHESNHAGLLRGGEGPAHCFMCHEETRKAIDEAPFVHEPMRDRCSTCHDPHATDNAHLLHQRIEKNCFGCHVSIEQEVNGAPSPHGAVFTGERCATCHDPHAAGRANLMRDREADLCLQCHGEPVRAHDGRQVEAISATLEDRAFLHGPIRNGECSPCHNVHGATHSRLLNERFTDAFYAPFDLKNYALCFNCHVQDLVTDAQTTALTDFRNGSRNLHFVHVNQDRKGRTCRTCHEIHGSNLPRHMAESVPFEGSGWAMMLRYEKLENGGSCTPGCHARQTYVRNIPEQDEPADSEGGTP